MGLQCLLVAAWTAIRGAAKAVRLNAAAITATLGIALSPGWAAATEAHAGTLISAGLLPTATADQTLGIFRSGFEATENNCASGPDTDDDGLLDPFCIQQFAPPDPAAVAPPINPTVVTDFIDANEFIGSGPTPIQVGLQPGVIERYRAAITRGRVLDEAGEPLPHVLVRVLDHPEYGYTYTRADGHYDLLVNGGGNVVLDFQKPDRLRAQRTIRTPWRDWALVDDVRMLRPDSLMTPVILGPNAPAQFAAGSEMSDEDGSRQAKVFFPAGTSATMTLPNGQQQALPVMHFRATEYTVGEGGPERMPGQLPPSSAYTYAVELSADQALATGATRVDFNQPVGLYVDNFIGFPVGEIVPAGWYDFRAGTWVASDNGRVIKLLGVEQGLAQIDIDGSGQAADAAALLELGISAEERAHLAQNYAAGAELWRTPLDHLTPWDCNWPFVPPDDSEEPDDPDFEDDENSGGDDDDPNNALDEAEDDLETQEPEQEDCEKGSIFYCQTQSIGLQVPLAGTSDVLSYRSDHTEAATLRSRFSLRLTTRTLPASLRRAWVDLQLLGVRHRQFAELEATIDGRQRFRVPRVSFELLVADAYGRTGWQGTLPYQFSVSYRYAGRYVEAPQEFDRAFARFSGLPFASNVTLGRAIGGEIFLRKIWRPTSLPMARSSLWNAKGQGLGGWMLGSHQVLDPAGFVVYEGGGGRTKLNPERGGVGGGTLTRSASTPELEFAARQLTPAGNLMLLLEETDADGVLWQTLAELQPNGQQRLFARSCVGFDVDGLNEGGRGGIDICPAGTRLWERARRHHVDDRGRVVLIGTEGMYRIWRGARVEALALANQNTGVPCEGQAVAMATHADQVYVACDNQVILVDAGGVGRVAGGGLDTGESVPALQARFLSLNAMTADRDGNLILADSNRIRRIGADGRVKTLVGNGQFGNPANGGLALEQRLASIMGLAVNSEGLLYFTHLSTGAGGSGATLHELTREGRTFIRAGGGADLWNETMPDRAFARSVRLQSALIPLPLPDGGIRLIDHGSWRLLTYGDTFADRWQDEAHRIPAADGSVVQEFDPRGRHLRTLHPLTGGVLRSFGYDATGRLTHIDDAFGNRTSIVRDAQGFRIRSPWGVESNFVVGAGGYIEAAELPAGRNWQFTNEVGGLYGGMRTPNGDSKEYVWNPLRPGRLYSSKDATGESWQAFPFALPARQARVAQRVSPESRVSSSSLQFNRWNGTSRHRQSRDGTNSYSLRTPDGGTRYSDNSGLSYEARSSFDPQLLLSEYPRRVEANGTVVERQRTVSVGGSLGSTDRTEAVSIDGRTSTRAYDATERLWTVRSPEGRETHTWINSQGQALRRSIAGLADIEYAYDNRGRLEAVHVGSGAARRTTRMNYDTRGYLDWAEDPLQRRVTYQRDDLGRPERIRLPDNREIGLGWDANNNLTEVVPPGRTAHVFEYTPADRMRTYRPPTAGAGDWSTSYPRDRDQELNAAQRPDGRSITLQRDNGRTSVRTVTYSGRHRYISRMGTQVSSVFELLGQRLDFDWDQGRLLAQIWSGPADAVTGEVRYTYGSASRLTGIAITSGASVTYGYDNDSLLTSATVGATRLDLVRNAANGLLEGTGVGSLTDAWTHNQFAEPTAYSAIHAGTPLFQASYGRDRLGRIETRSESAAGSSFADTYAYALSGRLDTVHRGSALVSDYGFDDNGNRTTHRIGPASPLRGQSWPCLGALPAGGDSTVSGSYDAQDRMTAYGSCSYEYTRNGELTRRVDSATNSTTEYDYDEFGNLRRVVLPDTRVITYHIDGLNRRVGKSINGVRQWGLLYANQLEPVAELDAAGNVVASFIYADRPHVPSLMLKGGQTYRILADHLGSVRLVVNIATGAVAQRMAYDEYGNVVEDTNPGFQPFGYAGGIYDRDTGLVRFGARDYDAAAGRWTSKDKRRFLGTDGAFYSYAENDPLNLFDLDGHQSRPVNPWNQFQRNYRGSGMSVQQVREIYRQVQLNKMGGPSSPWSHEEISNGPDLMEMHRALIEMMDAGNLNCNLLGECQIKVEKCKCSSQPESQFCPAHAPQPHSVGPLPQFDPNCSCRDEWQWLQ